MRQAFRYSLVLALGAVLGLAARYIRSRQFSYSFKTTRDLHLLLEGARSIGVLPEGAPLLAARGLGRDSKRGWWACMPVRLGAETEAREVVRATDHWDITEPMLWATAAEGAEVFPREEMPDQQ